MISQPATTDFRVKTDDLAPLRRRPVPCGRCTGAGFNIEEYARQKMRWPGGESLSWRAAERTTGTGPPDMSICPTGRWRLDILAKGGTIVPASRGLFRMAPAPALNRALGGRRPPRVSARPTRESARRRAGPHADERPAAAAETFFFLGCDEQTDPIR